MLHLIKMKNGEQTIQKDINTNVQQWDAEQEYLKTDMERKLQ